MVETWAPIPDRPGYEVSNIGRIRSYRNAQGHPMSEPRVLTPIRTRSGRLKIKLGRTATVGIHRLVLLAFRGPAGDDQECRHLNGNPLDNRIENLAWGTKVENYNDRRAHGTDNAGERHGNARLTAEAVRAIRASDESGPVLATRYGVTVVTISSVRLRKSWKSVTQ